MVNRILLVSLSLMIDYDQKGIQRMLLFLLQGEKNINDFKEGIEEVGQNQLYKNLELLKKMKLVAEKKGPYNARIFKLTEKGRKVAEKIQEIQEILEE